MKMLPERRSLSLLFALNRAQSAVAQMSKSNPMHYPGPTP